MSHDGYRLRSKDIFPWLLVDEEAGEKGGES